MPVDHVLRGEKGRPLMARRAPLDNVDHQHLRVIGGPASEVSVNQALVVPSEFEQLQREYPILFRKDSDGGFQAVAILGLDRGENLFLSEGEWTTHYVPATLRRGPLFLGVGDEEPPGDAAIVIDLDDPRVSEAEGEPLFLPHGGAAPFLQQAADALRTVHEGLALSRTMFARFAELDLIAPVEISVEVGDGTRYRLADLFTVDAGRFTGLSGAELESLNRAGFLAAAIHARSSLANIDRLIELKTSKLARAADA
jgi:SapC protein